MHSNHHTSQLLARHIGLACLLVSFAGCLLPEFDTPPIDPALIKDDSPGSGGGTTACVAGVYQNSVNLTVAGATTTYAGECTISGKVTINVDFPTYKQLAAVRRIQGVLVIRGAGAGPAVSPLPNLTDVDQSVLISATQLGHLPVFPKLSTIKVSLQITGNTKAVSIAGFDALRQVGALQVSNNAATTWKTFGKLEDVSGAVGVNNNYNLTSVTFASVGNFFGGLQIDKNACAEINLPSAHNIDGLFIQANTKLASVRAPMLTAMSQFTINANQLLSNTSITLGKLKTLGHFTLRRSPTSRR